MGDADKIDKQVSEYMEDEFKEIPLSEVLEMICEDPEELLYDKNITCKCGKCDPTIKIEDTMLTISCKNCKKSLEFDLKDTKSLSFIINSTNINI